MIVPLATFPNPRLLTSQRTTASSRVAALASVRVQVLTTTVDMLDDRVNSVFIELLNTDGFRFSFLSRIC